MLFWGVSMANTISAAKGDNYKSYIKWPQKLEEICAYYDSVEKSYTIQAGREVRIIIRFEMVNAEWRIIIARDVA